MKKQVEFIGELKTGRQLLLIRFKKLSTFKMVRKTLAVFTVGCLQDYYERDQRKYILREFETSAW